MFRRLAVTTALGLVAASPGGQVLAASPCTWSGGTGDWNDAKWDCGHTPGSGDDVRIDANPGVASTVNISSNQNASTVTLDSGDTIAINYSNLNIYGGSVANNGTIALSNYAQLIGQGTTAITGTGTITLDNGANPARLYGNGSSFLSIGSGQTVSGAGEVGYDAGALTNSGIINANLNGRTLVLDARGGSGGNSDGSGLGTYGAGMVNTGLLEATNGATLSLSSGLYDNRGGTIQAVGTGSVVALNNDASIVGGNFTSSGGGQISAGNSGTQYLTDVTLTGGSTLNVNYDTVRFGDKLTNNGAISLVNYAQLIGNSPSTTIDGTGTITLDNSNNPARLYGDGSNKLTLGSGQTVSGAGEVGYDSGAVTNNGVINANLNGRTLTLDARGGSGGNGDMSGVGTNNSAGFLNNNLLEATNGATLLFNSGVYQNGANGVIQAVGAGSVVALNGDSSIVGGVLTSSGGGQINAVNSGTQYLTDVTLTNGTNLNVNYDTVRIGDKLTNNGAISLVNYAQLIGNSGPTTIDGTGTITLDNGSNPARLFGDGSNKLTLGSGQTVSGAGEVGYDAGALTNNGVINANLNGRTLVLDARGGSGGNSDGSGLGTYGAGMVNANLLEATNGATLLFNSGLYDNRGGTIQAVGTGSVVALNGDSSIVGGNLTSSGGGQFIANNSGTQYLTDVTLTDGTNLNVNYDTVRIGDKLTNNGAISLVNYAQLIGNSPGTTIDGTGTITLDNSNNPARLYGDGSNKLTLGSGQTVSGAGEVGYDSGAITNNGVINANLNGRTLTLDARGGSGGNGDGSGLGTYNAGMVNNNLLEATNGATLGFSSGVYDNSAGRIQAVGTGSVVALNSDASIVGGTLASSGGGQISASSSGTQYITDVTLASGSNFNINNDVVRIGDVFTNNGSVSVSNYSYLIGNSPNTTINGTGTITLDNSANPARLYGDGSNRLTIGSGQIVRGSGEVGYDSGAITNAGNILADGAITIDARGGGSGNGDMSGVGTGNLAGFYNAAGGQVQANNGGATLTLASGLYEQAAGGSFSVGTNSTFEMASDANLVNLQSGGVLNKGLYFAFAGGTMDLRSDQTGAITTIGTNNPGTDTIVTLSGAGSTIEVTPRGGSTATTIDQSLQSVARSGELVITDGRTFTAQNGAFSNAGTVAVRNGSVLAAPGGFTNSGTVTGGGDSTVTAPITNSGTVVADSGTFSVRAITGATGTIQSNAGATLSLAGAAGSSTAGFLVNNGALDIGSHNVTVTSDYQNANFGSGNGFDAHANVTGSGQILAASATMDLSGPGLSTDGTTLNVGNVRLGGSSSTTLTITNNGTLTTLRGAVESPTTNTVNISSSNFVVGPNGGNTQVKLSYTGTQAGSLAGQTITVANNFDNVADKTLNIQGAAYNPAAASLSPNPINLGATRTGGTLSGTVTIANTAPNSGYSEKLAVTGTSGSGGASGSAPGGLVNPGSSANSTVTLNTSTSGTKSGMVTYALATDGTGISGLAQMALPSQSVTVNGKVYQAAVAQLDTTNVTFATVRQGASAPTASVTVTNGANGALNDSLNTSIGSTPAGVTGTAPGALAGGQIGAAVFTENTSTAGTFGGNGQLNFTSTDPDLAPLTLPSQTVTFAGTVTQVAVAQIVKDSGAGTLAPGGTSAVYTLDLGTIMAGTGSVMTDLGVLNAIPHFSYDETLGGTFSGASATGYSFSGNTFSGDAGGTTNMGNNLTFTYTGLGDGTYTDTLTFAGYSRYAGLSDLSLSPIRVNVTARISGSTGGGGTSPGAVPEPATWTTMLFGFGAIGTAMRRRRRSVGRHA